MCCRAILNLGRVSDANKRIVVNVEKFYPNLYVRARAYQLELGTKGLQRAVERCLQEGLVDPGVDIELMTQLFFSMMNSVIYDNALVIPQEITKEEAYAALFINFFRGIATERGRQVIDDILAREPKPLTLAERRAQKQKNDKE